MPLVPPVMMATFPSSIPIFDSPKTISPVMYLAVRCMATADRFWRMAANLAKPRFVEAIPLSRCWPRELLWAAALLISAAAAPGPARAGDDSHRLTIVEENDSLFFDSDKHYTQGLRLGYLSPDVKSGSHWDEPFEFHSPAL